MIRRFNYTNRIRINRKDIHITLQQKSGESWFDADLTKLADYELPPDGLVFVEAYRQTNWMRFAYGTVKDPNPEQNRALRGFDTPEGILFRVKVTPPGDIHKLLAEGDRIPLVSPEQLESEQEPLLPVKPQKLGDEIYRVDFSGDYPLLLINSEAGNYRDIGRSPAFVALVYPAVFREILTQIVIMDKHTDGDDSDDWRSRWVKFAMTLPGLGDLPETDDEENRKDWIIKAVATFAKRIQVRAKFTEFWEKGA
jgi:hypothetical protein